MTRSRLCLVPTSSPVLAWKCQSTLWSQAESLFICKQGYFDSVVIILNGPSQGNAFDYSWQHTVTAFIAPLMSLCCTDRSVYPLGCRSAP